MQDAPAGSKEPKAGIEMKRRVMVWIRYFIGSIPPKCIRPFLCRGVKSKRDAVVKGHIDQFEIFLGAFGICCWDIDGQGWSALTPGGWGSFVRTDNDTHCQG